jgi:Fe-S-cluster containining protein
MSAIRGHDCKTCNGNCCKILIAYEKPDNVSDLGDVTKYTDSDLRAHGYIRIIEQDVPSVCEHLTTEGRCSIHKTKSKLCKSYWCRGSLWRKKEHEDA